jgi:hypothetical protein
MRRQARKNGRRIDGHARPVARSPRRVLIVAVPPVRTLDVFGPVEVFGDANRLHGGDPTYEVNIISSGPERVVLSHMGAPLNTDQTYRECHGPIDWVARWPARDHSLELVRRARARPSVSHCRPGPHLCPRRQLLHISRSHRRYRSCTGVGGRRSRQTGGCPQSCTNHGRVSAARWRPIAVQHDSCSTNP